MPYRFRVPRRTGVGCSDQVDEADRAQDGEGLAVGQQVEVAADDDQVVGLADGFHEVGDPLGLRTPVGGVGFAASVAQAVHVDDRDRTSGSRLDEPQRQRNAWTIVAGPLVVRGEGPVHVRRLSSDDH